MSFASAYAIGGFVPSSNVGKLPNRVGLPDDRDIRTKSDTLVSAMP